MNGTYRNGGGYAGIPAAAMVPATYSPAASHGALCPEAYEAEKCNMMCDVCDMLQDICDIVADTNRMVKHIYNKIHRETENAPSEANRK